MRVYFKTVNARWIAILRSLSLPAKIKCYQQQYDYDNESLKWERLVITHNEIDR